MRADPQGSSPPLPGTDTAPRVAADDLRLRLGGREILRGLSFAVAPGEVFGILGPNGAGKTTAFHVIAGLLRPDAGRLLLDGSPLGPGDRRLRERMGVVFQQPSLDPRLSARQNLRLAAGLFRVGRAEARERAAALLELAELGDRADEPVARFSGGMKRRLEICRALMGRPEILLLDEPTSGLDEAAFQRTWQQLLSLREREGLTVIVTTHRPEEGEHCDRIAVLDAGAIVACDTPARLKSHVSGDVVVVSAADPDEVSAVLQDRLGLACRRADGQVTIEHPRGHELIPRLVEAFPPGRLAAVSLHRPSLADVFLHLTGRVLTEEQRR